MREQFLLQKLTIVCVTLFCVMMILFFVAFNQAIKIEHLKSDNEILKTKLNIESLYQKEMSSMVIYYRSLWEGCENNCEHLNDIVADMRGLKDPNSFFSSK
jgi:hypothetical protein